MSNLQEIYNYTRVHESLFHQIPGFIGVATLDNKFAFGNNKMIKAMGFELLDDFINVDFANVKCEVAKDADLFKKESGMVIKHSKIVSTVGYHSYADGWRLILCEKAPLYGANNNTIGTIAYWTDITNYNLVDYSSFISTSIKELIHTKKSSFSYILDDGSLNSYKLSERQIECLFFLLRGKSTKDIGNILSLSSRTVESYINEIKFKMSCLTKGELIEKAFYEGLINIIPKSYLQK